MKVMVVDWLGRGGIAQTADAWRIEFEAAEVDVVLATRPDREVAADVALQSDLSNRLLHHLSVVRQATAALREQRPDVVVIQNWLIPFLEAMLHHEARKIGARVVLVAHNHGSHGWAAGIDVGVASLLEKADDVVVHSEFVAERLPGAAGLNRSLLPLPKPLGLLAEPRPRPALQPGDRPTALHFGVRRKAKGADFLPAIQKATGGTWDFAIAGTMADGDHGLDPDISTVTVIPGFVGPGELCALVAASQAVVLPYSKASQSAAVVLAQCLGSVPVSSEVGGIPEQITDGRDGLLLPPGADAAQWTKALGSVVDLERQAELADNAGLRMERDHQIFREGILEVIGLESPKQPESVGISSAGQISAERAPTPQ